MGQAEIDSLRLTNIRLETRSILDVDRSFGEFDYILCHGVYSWVPAVVRDKILAVCADNLAPDGVAYVSYNTYPGWHLRGMIREMLGYHAGRFASPTERVGQARAFLEFLVEAVGGPTNMYGSFLQKEVEMLQCQPDTYVFHEHLEEENQPIYFHQFAARAAACGLQYLAEADPTPLRSNLTSQVRDTLEHLADDIIRGEQYLDFVRGRSFRRTLLCRAEAPIRRPPAADRVTGMHVTTFLKPVSGPGEVPAGAAEMFITAEEATLASNNPVVRTALRALHEVWPRSLPFAGLLAEVRARLAGSPQEAEARSEDAARALADALLQCYFSKLVELHVRPPQLVVNLSERPVASPLARLQAGGAGMITNLRHRSVELNGLERILLRHLDGSRDRRGLIEALTDDLDRGDVELQHEGQPIADRGKARAVLEEALGPSLTRLARSALLVG
jgi:methyltransferase-like protein